MTIAKTILQQLGGSRFIAMTGAKQFIDGGEYLRFKIPTTRKIQYVQIMLNVMDTYDVEYQRFNPKTLEKTVIAESRGLYADMLQADFTEKTGLYTSL